MKKLKILNILGIVGIILIFSCNSIVAQQEQHKQKNTQVFVDKDGDGYNDNAPDHDGDGIPNGLDSDWTKEHRKKMKFVDADGDGINDLIQKSDHTELQNENMPQNGYDESMMNNSQEKHMNRKREEHNNWDMH